MLCTADTGSYKNLCSFYQNGKQSPKVKGLDKNENQVNLLEWQYYLHFLFYVIFR